MSKIFNILTIGVQLGLSFIVTVCIYMVFALLDYEGGFNNFIGLAISQPIIAVILSALTIVCCFLLGLPIRLIRNIKKWWIRHFYFAIGLTLLGLTLLGLSLAPQFIEHATITRDGHEMTKSIPHGGLAITGWLLTAFSILHLYPPDRLSIKAQNILNNLT